MKIAIAALVCVLVPAAEAQWVLVSSNYQVSPSSQWVASYANFSGVSYWFTQQNVGKTFTKYCIGDPTQEPPGWSPPFATLFTASTYRIEWSISSLIPPLTGREWIMSWDVGSGGETWRYGSEPSISRITVNQFDHKLTSFDYPLGSGEGDPG